MEDKENIDVSMFDDNDEDLLEAAREQPVRKAKKVTLREIQGWWEVPCIAQYISLFHYDFSLPDFDIECLERMLMNRGKDPVTGNTINELVARLLKGIYITKKGSIETDCYDKYFRRFIRTRCLPINMDLGDDFNIYTPFVDLPARNQVLILHALCYIRIDPDLPYSGHVLKTSNLENIRTEPLGKDSEGTCYWHFGGWRLYEDRYVSEDERLWDLRCTKSSEWKKLCGDFEDSEDSDEQALYAALIEKLFIDDKLPMRVKRKLGRHTISGIEISNPVKPKNGINHTIDPRGRSHSIGFEE